MLKQKMWAIKLVDKLYHTTLSQHDFASLKYAVNVHEQVQRNISVSNKGFCNEKNNAKIIITIIKEKKKKRAYLQGRCKRMLLFYTIYKAIFT